MRRLKNGRAAWCEGPPSRRTSAVALAALAVVSLAGPSSAAFEVVWPDAVSAAMLERGDLASRMLAVDASDAVRVSFSGGELYGVREAAGGSVAVTGAPAGIPVGVSATTLGGDLYRERTLAACVAWSPDEHTGLALVLRSAGVGASGVEDRWAVSIDAGFRRVFLGRLVASACGVNLTDSAIGGSPLASRTTLRLALELDSATLACSVMAESGFAPNVTTGVEVRMSEWLLVRAGAGHEPGRLGVGLGLGREGSGWWPMVDVAWQWHPRLGVSSFVSATFRI